MLCQDRTDSDCVESYLCSDVPNWMDDYHTDCHYWVSNSWCLQVTQTTAAAAAEHEHGQTFFSSRTYPRNPYRIATILALRT